jgi:hypothetical protein
LLITQEQIDERTVALVWRGTKFTGRVLAKLLKKLLDGMKKNAVKAKNGPVHKGKMTVKQLLSSGDAVSSAEITDQNIRSFEPIARKWGVDFALFRDDSVSPPKWTALFKSKQADAMLGAFKEYSAKAVSRTADKPSVVSLLRKMVERVQNQVVDKTRTKEHTGPER